MRRFVSIVAAVLVPVLASCSSGSNGLPASSVSSDATTSSAAVTASGHSGRGRARATVRIRIPKRRHHRGHGSKYLSPATQSIAITITNSISGQATTYNENLTGTSPGCTPVPLTCTFSYMMAAGTYSAAFATFDGTLGPTGSPTGNELSANQDVTFTLTQGAGTTVPVTLDAIPASVQIFPTSTSTLSGNMANGYSIERCTAVPQKINVLTSDADGNLIIGPGAPTVAVTSSNSTALAIATPSPTSPNTFAMTPPAAPALAYPGTKVVLTASATPGTASGASPLNVPVNVTFTSDICGVITEYQIPTPNASPQGIAPGPDGAIWFTENATNKIGRIPTTATVSNPQITEYSIPTASSHPYGIAAGPDGALWFTECVSSQISRITTDGSSILEFPTITTNAAPQGIAAGPDGAIWFTESHGNNIGRLPVTGSIKMTEYSVPTTKAVPYNITAGPDGAMWFVESLGNNIGRIPTTATVNTPGITEYPLPLAGSFVRDITLGPNNALWFAQSNASYVGSISTSGSIAEFQDEDAGQPKGITTGPDGAIWFVEKTGNSIGRVPISGSPFTYIPIPTKMSVEGDPRIILGPDGSLWFTETSANQIGRLQ